MPTLKDTRIAFHSCDRRQRRSLFFPFQTSGWNIRLPEASAERRSTRWALKPPSLSVSRSLSLSLSGASHPIRSIQRDRHRQNTLSATCTSNTDESSQTCLILSGWHRKIHREKSLTVCPGQTKHKSKQCTKTNTIRTNNSVLILIIRSSCAARPLRSRLLKMVF